jgi:dsRNA-specific ribonuclease
MEAALPYNPRNLVLSKKDLVNELLVPFGHDGQVKDINLFRNALVHKSYCVRKNENVVTGNTGCPPGCLPLQEQSLERVEFLGDAVVSLVISEALHVRHPGDDEGVLSARKLDRVQSSESN